MTEVVTVGGITLDWVVGLTGRVNVKGCGGNSLYAAVGAHLWSERVAVVSRVGRDYPAEYLHAFRESGIDMSGVRQLAEPHELVAAYRYESDGTRHDIIPARDLPRMGFDSSEAREEHALFHPTSWAADLRKRFDPCTDDVLPGLWQARGFHVGNMCYEAQLAFCDRLARTGVLFTLDASNPSITEFQRRELMRRVPVFLPSEVQVAWLLNEAMPDLERAPERLASFGPTRIAIKVGRLGSIVYDARTGQHCHIPAYPARVVDPTGAGDSYCGGFLAGLVETEDMVEAALCATVSASFVIEGFDARYGLQFGRKEALERLQWLRARVQHRGDEA
jgi:sugar/nucleoside kinase (ribokinase family)